MPTRTPPYNAGPILNEDGLFQSDIAIEVLESRVCTSVTPGLEVQAQGQSDHVPVLNSVHVVNSPAPLSSSIAAPGNLSVTYSVAAGKGTVRLTWTESDPSVTGYVVMHRIGAATTFTQAGKVTGGATRVFTETVTAGNTAIAYNVIAVTKTGTSQASDSVSMVTSPSTPVNVAAQMIVDTTTGTNNVAVFWMDSDPNISAYRVLRSTDGGSFVQIAQTRYAGYTDTTATPDTLYKYTVQAIGTNANSAVSAVSQIITAPGTPTSLVAGISGGKVNVSWDVSDPKAKGYTMWRSSDGITYKQLATLAGATNRRYTDLTLTTGSVAYYKVATTGPGGTSLYSTPIEVRMPSAANWSVTTRFGNELVLNDTAGADTILVSQAGTKLIFSVNGSLLTQTLTAGGLFIYLHGGGDSVTIDASVTSRATVVAINGSGDTVNDAGTTHNVWIDSDDSFNGAARVHRVASFEGGVSKSAGASLPNPAGMRSYVTLNLSLLGAGVTPSDCLQGQAGDCYLIGLFASLAGTTPSAITSSVVDMGDGTYTVQFFSSGSPQYYRVSNQFASIGQGLSQLYYASYGAANTVWAPVMEKAFAYYRRGENTYASINGGSFGEVYDALGIQSNTFNPASYTDAQLFTALSGKLGAGKSVAFATSLTPQTLVRAHAYSLLSVANVNGVYKYTVRNPWGFGGSSLENRSGVAVLTYSQLLTNFAGGTWAA
jgi:hypothetical protein